MELKDTLDTEEKCEDVGEMERSLGERVQEHNKSVKEEKQSW